MKIFLSIIGLTISLMAYNNGTWEGNVKACEAGEGRACNDLAGMYLSGKLPKDHEFNKLSYTIREDRQKSAAKHYYDKSKDCYMEHCYSGSGKDCFGLAQYYNGMKWNVEQDLMKMLKYNTKGCDNGYAKSCIEVGSSHKRGYGIKRNKVESDKYYAKAVTALERECKDNLPGSCKSLSMIYKLNMYGTDKADEAEALQRKAFNLYEDLCEKKDDEGCFQMATYNYNGRLTPVDWKKAKYYYEKSCEYGQDSACWKARDINVSKQYVLENRMKLRNLMVMYGMMEEKEKKARKERSVLQMKEIQDPSKTKAEKEAALEKAMAENVIWNKEYDKRIQAIRKAHEDEKKVLEAQIK